LSRRRREYKTMSEINVTNLVDVVLVLLIVFMISAPLLQSGIDIELPQTTYTTDTDVGEGVVVTITAKDSLGIFVGSGQSDDRYAGPVEFERVFKEFYDKDRTQPVYLRADKRARWEFVIDIIAKIKKQGVPDLGLITSPYEEP
jgi:biopolymer transport protein TolR